MPRCELCDVTKVMRYFEHKRYTEFALDSLDASGAYRPSVLMSPNNLMSIHGCVQSPARAQLDVLLATNPRPTTSTMREWVTVLKIPCAAAVTRYAAEWRKHQRSEASKSAESSKSLKSGPHYLKRVETSTQRDYTFVLMDPTKHVKTATGLEKKGVLLDSTSTPRGNATSRGSDKNPSKYTYLRLS